ncbi:MAG: hypothetical protein RDU24_13765 [Humidesulfovibrio sp.]|uniref:hypothetical protein n=1 Tax=Humidesulfovibrio sp. TaxID=2910988 RepID=UPI0027E6E898|nr:hypothetical protein [Humidesulfovibrio sp.]MDQ7836443.1 hypothetical protein [Humidesulfovibrio sp.]
MVSYLEGDSDEANTAYGHYTGPRGGWASFVDGGYGVFGGGDFGGGGATSELPARKLAGADSERTDEPASLLSATPEHLERMGGFGEAVSKGAAGAGEALSQTWDALTTNKDLHKGVEFGIKAAGEVTKDVAWEAGKDAAKALGGYWFKNIGKDPKLTAPLGTAAGLIFKGVKLYDRAPGWGQDIGDRLYKIKEDIYSKE